MQFETPANVFRACLKELRAVVIVAFSFSPRFLSYFEHVPEIFVLYQNVSYPADMTSPQEKRTYKKQFQRLPNVLCFSTKRRSRQHLHGKCILGTRQDGTAVYIQFSHNLDVYFRLDDPQLLYYGIPQRLEKITTVLTEVGCPHNMVWTFKTALQNTQPNDDDVFILQTPDVENASVVIPRILQEQGAYVTHSASETSMVMHFPYANVYSYHELCDGVVRAFSSNAKEANATVLRFLTPKKYGHGTWRHESWIARFYKNRMAWFALTTFNVTSPSFGPLARNYEFAVLTFRVKVQLQAFVSWRLSHADVHAVSVRCWERDTKTNTQYDMLDKRGREKPVYLVRACQMLLHEILPLVTTVQDLLQHRMLKENMYCRLALYDLLFCVLGKGYQTSTGRPDRGRVYDVFYHNVNKMHTLMVRQNKLLNSLVEVYCRWYMVFQMFDPSIVEAVPVPSESSLVTPPTHKVMLHYSEIRNSPYRALSYVLQNMYNNQPTWWRCITEGHCFFNSVRHVMQSIHPTCPVCSQSRREFHTCINALARHTSFVTPSMPMFSLCRRRRGFREMSYDVFAILYGEMCAVSFSGDKEETKRLAALSAVLGVHFLHIPASSNAQRLITDFLMAVRQNKLCPPLTQSCLFSFMHDRMTKLTQGSSGIRLPIVFFTIDHYDDDVANDAVLYLCSVVIHEFVRSEQPPDLRGNHAETSLVGHVVTISSREVDPSRMIITNAAVREDGNVCVELLPTDARFRLPIQEEWGLDTLRKSIHQASSLVFGLRDPV